MNKFYVYIYWRLDTNNPFYIGKGCDYRWKRLDRNYNQHFINIINKHPIAVEIVKDNLTEEQAFYWEEKIIEILVFEYGYSIDIPNNRGDEKSPHLVNATWGGEGASGHNSREGKTEEELKMCNDKISKSKTGVPLSDYHKKRISEGMMGENNHFYGKQHTEETKRKISEKNKGNTNPFKNMSKEQIDEWRLQHSENFKGDKNPMAKSVICLTTKKIFTTIKEGSLYYKISQSEITRCCNGYRIVKGKKERRLHAGKLSDGTKLKWRWLIWQHNFKYRIKNLVDKI